MIKLAGLVLFAFGSTAGVGGTLTHRGNPTGQAEDPPLKVVAWDPPATSIDVGYVRMAKALLGNGLADPRRGVFSKVMVSLGDGAGSGPHPMEGFGWVLPGGRRAVLLDGLECAITSVVAPLAIDSIFSPKGDSKPIPVSPLAVNGWTEAEPALLLLAGRADLAERAFHGRASNGMEQPAYLLAEALRSRYTMQVAESLIDHTDTEGANWARLLLTSLLVEAQQGAKPSHPELTRITPDLDMSRGLYRDMVGRVEHPKPVKIDLDAVRKLDTKRRIAFYLDNLDEIAGRQYSQPGDIDFNMDPLFKAILDEGQAMIPGLIEALQNDTRYTRSISFFREFFAQRKIHSVRNAVRELISQIWPSSFRWMNGDAVSTAIALRTAWNSQARFSEPERWADVLADDKADPSSWLRASFYLVSPLDEVRHGGWVQLSREPNSPMKGEALRASRGAEIANLMDKRAVQLVDTPIRSTLEMNTRAMGLDIGHCLAKWAPRSHVQTLAALAHRVLADVGSYGDYFETIYGRAFGDLTTDRVLQGDRTALSDYAEASKYFKMNNWVDIGLYRMFWSFPQDLEVQKLAVEALRPEEQSLISPDPAKPQQAMFYFMGNALHSPMLTVPTFRKILSEGIQNEAVAGMAWSEPESNYEGLRFKFDGGANGSVGPSTVPSGQPSGKQVQVTVGDYLAQVAEGIAGAPAYCLIWEPSKRKTAKQELVKWLLTDKHDWLVAAKASPFYRDTY